jgi:FecR protein
MIHKTIRIVLAGLLLGLFAPAAWAQEAEIIASLQRIEGSVSVVQAANKETVQGRNGLLLHGGDTVVTGQSARATIKFRDGSEIRLFPNTNFVVEAKEKEGSERVFSVNLVMKIGSFWGNFVKQRQVANISTPTATIGIKGTTLRVVERDGQARVALTEGLIAVNNDRESVELQPGQRLPNFTRTDSLADKVQTIPFKLDLRSDQKKLEFRNNQPEEVFISIQIVDIKSSNPVRRAGPVYLRSNYDKIEYPSQAILDERGFARVAIKVMPPEASDSELNGNVYVWALLDQEQADDTAEGRILFTIPIPSGQERIRIESKTGEGRRVK